MPDKPEYIDLLNAIRAQESNAGVYLSAWAEKTDDPDLKHCLSFVAEREFSHGEIFDRRVRELGFETYEVVDPDFEAKVRLVSSDVTDEDKITGLKELGSRQPKPTVRDQYVAAMEDETVDPLTRSLIKWFNEVEGDSRGLIEQTYAKFENKG